MFLHYISKKCGERPEEKYCIKANDTAMIPICTPTGPQAKLGQKWVPSYLAVVSKIPEAAHMASLFCWSSYHSQPELGDYDNIASSSQSRGQKAAMGEKRTDRRFYSDKVPGQLLTLYTVPKGGVEGLPTPRTEFLSICSQI